MVSVARNWRLSGSVVDFATVYGDAVTEAVFIAVKVLAEDCDFKAFGAGVLFDQLDDGLDRDEVVAVLTVMDRDKLISYQSQSDDSDGVIICGRDSPIMQRNLSFRCSVGSLRRPKSVAEALRFSWEIGVLISYFLNRGGEPVVNWLADAVEVVDGFRSFSSSDKEYVRKFCRRLGILEFVGESTRGSIRSAAVPISRGFSLVADMRLEFDAPDVDGDEPDSSNGVFSHVPRGRCVIKGDSDKIVAIRAPSSFFLFWYCIWLRAGQNCDVEVPTATIRSDWLALADSKRVHSDITGWMCDIEVVSRSGDSADARWRALVDPTTVDCQPYGGSKRFLYSLYETADALGIELVGDASDSVNPDCCEIEHHAGLVCSVCGRSLAPSGVDFSELRLDELASQVSGMLRPVTEFVTENIGDITSADLDKLVGMLRLLSEAADKLAGSSADLALNAEALAEVRAKDAAFKASVADSERSFMDCLVSLNS